MESAAGSIHGIYMPLTGEERAANPPDVGIYTGISYPTYHSWQCASNSALGDLLRSPAHMKAKREEPPEDTVSSLIGHAVHCAVLEPDDFDARYALALQCTATTGRGSQCSNTASRFHPDYGWLCGTHAKGKEGFDDSRALLTPSEWKTALGVRDSVWHHPAAKALLTGEGENELSVVYNHIVEVEKDVVYEDVRVKTRPDRLSREIAGGTVLDVKTTQDAREDAFAKSVFSYGYYRQGALYLDALLDRQVGIQHFTFLAIEKEPPYACALYRLTEGAADIGRELNAKLLARYLSVERTHEYPAYHTDVRDITVPDWAWGVIDAQIKGLSV